MDSIALAHLFVDRRFIGVGETPPSTHVVDKHCHEIDLLALYVFKQSSEPRPALDVQPTFSIVLVRAHDFHAVRSRELSDVLGLIFRRVTLMLCRHARVLRDGNPLVTTLFFKRFRIPHDRAPTIDVERQSFAERVTD